MLLICGIASPLLYALADFLAGMRWESYSFRDQTISELGAIGAPSRALFSALLVPVYVLLAAFGYGVRKSAGGRRRLARVGGLLVVLGIMALAVGQFVPMRARGTEQGLTGAMHLVEGSVATLIILLAMGLAATVFERAFRIYTVVSLAVVLGFGAWSGMDALRVEAGMDTPWLGVRERIFWYAYQLWFIVLASTLLGERNAGSGLGGAATGPAPR